MLAPRLRLVQSIWFLSRPWPHLGGLRELVARNAFRVKWEAADGQAKEKTIEGCASVPVAANVDEAQLIQSLDSAEELGRLLPEAEVIAWRAALEAAPLAAIPKRLLAYGAADAGLRALGLPLAAGLHRVWPVAGQRRPEAPVAEWLELVPDAAAPERVLPGLSLQQEIALAQALGQDRLVLAGPFQAAITHIPQREAAMMADFHGDLYAPGPSGPRIGGGPDAVRVNAASIAHAVGFGYAQTIETHRRTGVGRLRGN